MFKNVWGAAFERLRIKAKNDNTDIHPEPSWMSAKALYDEAYDHLRQYELLFAQARAVDMACRHTYIKQGRVS